jgi:hypothetical protein
VKLKGFVLLIAVTAATAALWPAGAGASTFRGIVVAKQRGTLLVASPAGLVRAVSGRATLGSRVVVAGGRFAVVGHATKARIHGIVVRRIGSMEILSSNTHLVAVHSRTARRLADTAPASATGAVVDATVTISNGSLDEDDEQEVGQTNASSLQVSALVKAVGTGTVTLDVQGQQITIDLPAGLTLPTSIVGQTVTISLRLNDDNDDQDEDHHGDHHGGGGGDD